MNFQQKRKINSLLQVLLNGRELEFVLLHKSAGRAEEKGRWKLELSLNPLTDEDELVGREIRNFLEENEIRCSRCVVGWPIHRILSFQTEVPDLAEEDAREMLATQAEREFPFPVNELALSTQRFEIAPGHRYANVTALPRNHVEKLRRVFRFARLEILSVTLELEGWDRALSEECAVLVRLEENRLELIVARSRGWAVMRSVEVDPSWDEAETGEHFSREIRITMGQLDEAVHQSIQSVVLWRGRSAEPEKWRVLETRLRELEWPVREASKPLPLFGEPALIGAPPDFEYLPPVVRKFDQWVERFSTKKNLWLSTVGGGLAIVVGLAFLIQGHRLNALESQWSEMRGVVEELDSLQERIRFFRSWFDSNAPSLQIARHLAELFPAEGDVWIKELEIKQRTQVYCTGLARNNRAFLDLWGKLGESRSIGDLNLEQQAQRESQLQFAFNFTWKGEASHED